MTYPHTDTIAAIATPIGEGAIAIVRLSGKESLLIADTVFSGAVTKFKSHSAHYGKILNAKKQVVDSVLLLVMKGPNSYTGEDSVEIHCHGGSFITRKVLEAVLEAGARSALPGEFTYRAYHNGKMDLAQAEAVCQLIGAKNELALKAAEDQLEGRFSQKILSIQQELLALSAQVEAEMDYPDEDMEIETKKILKSKIEGSLETLTNLVKTYDEGKFLQEGISLCIVGSPNVGKSSLFNALCQKDRAIVTPIAGTTRDLLEEQVKMGQMTYHLIDTAGLRETEEIIEKEGIFRTRSAFEKADLILHVLDATRPLNPDDEELLKILPKEKTILLWNKTDICKPKETISALEISAKDFTGLKTLFETIEKRLMKNGFIEKGEVVLTHLRHKDALIEAIAHCQNAHKAIADNQSNEFIAEDLRFSLSAIGKILGTDVTEDILSSIFSKFCVGK